MRFSVTYSLFLLVLLTVSIPCSGEIRARSENGKTVFYNVPEKSAPQAVSHSAKPRKHDDYIVEVSRQHGVDPELVSAVIVAESGFNPTAVSPKGAVGLMQLMPATAQRFGVKNSYDPQDNIRGGVQYLKFLLDLFQQDLKLAVAAYNAGEGAVQRYQGVPRYRETQNYVQKVLSLYGKEDTGGAPKVFYRYTNSKGITCYSSEAPSKDLNDGMTKLSL